MTERARWLRFNMVGVAGFAVQMLTLATLERWSAPAGVAVTLAVLAAVSHNFLWHERVTWPGQPHQGRWRRWLSFNVSTGVVSLLTNLIVTTIVAEATGAPLLVSNVIAVVTASLANFWVSDRAVFNRNPRAWATTRYQCHDGKDSDNVHAAHASPEKQKLLPALADRSHWSPDGEGFGGRHRPMCRSYRVSRALTIKALPAMIRRNTRF